MAEVVVTGVGVLSPIGIGRSPFWQSLMEAKSGVRAVTSFDVSALRSQIGGQLEAFDPKDYIRPRKSLKVMSRDIQLAFAAADMAMSDAGLADAPPDPERLGVVFGSDMIPCNLDEIVQAHAVCIEEEKFRFDLWGQRALGELYPLLMLKYLPNMPACHISIAHDARGPNNTLVHGEVSSLLAIAEGTRVVERGQADVMIVGGASSQIHPTSMTTRTKTNVPLSRRNQEPERASRPFDRDRDGMVDGEGAAALILERADAARARGATVLARILGQGIRYETPTADGQLTGVAIRHAIEAALRSAGVTADEVDHVNAHGLSTRHDDRIEATAIRQTLGDVPVTAPKSFFGNLGAGSGAVELLASVLALSAGQTPITLNYETPDPECPVNVIAGESPRVTKPYVVKLSHNATGQAVALVLGRP